MTSAPQADRRAYAAALVLLAVGGAIVVVAYGMVWSVAEVPVLAGADDVTRAVEQTGRDLYPGSAMAGWVALAAVLGIVATRSWGRLVVGVIAALQGVGALLGPVRLLASGEPRTGAWWVAAAAGGALVIGAGAWTIRSGRSWPSMGARYDRQAGDGAPRPRPVSDWEAQDAGRDPTDDLVE